LQQRVAMKRLPCRDHVDVQRSTVGTSRRLAAMTDPQSVAATATAAAAAAAR